MHVEKIIPERVFLFLSLLFESMDILAGLMENIIGIKQVDGIDDAIVKFVFDKCVEKNGYIYFPDNIDIE